MADSKSGNAFTETLLSVIRQQRHLATRVIIATQEPTISPSLLDLCSMTLVHRFTSPAWLKALEDHLAGLSMEGEGSKEKLRRIFRRIVELNAGQVRVSYTLESIHSSFASMLLDWPSIQKRQHSQLH